MMVTPPLFLPSPYSQPHIPMGSLDQGCQADRVQAPLVHPQEEASFFTALKDTTVS